MSASRGRAPHFVFPVIVMIAALAAAAAAPAAPVQAGVAAAPAPSAKQVSELVGSYLQMVGAMREAALDPVRTQILVQHHIKEIYEKMGKPLEAVAEFRRLLETTKLPDARVSLHFSIVDVYNANGKNDEALSELRALFAENLARFPRK